MVDLGNNIENIDDAVADLFDKAVVKDGKVHKMVHKLVAADAAATKAKKQKRKTANAHVPTPAPATETTHATEEPHVPQLINSDSSPA